MPAPTRTLSIQSARDLIRERSFPKRTLNRVGVELEWFTTPSSDPPDVETLKRLLDAVMPLRAGSKVSFEPGGQVELSSAALDGCSRVIDAIASDAAIVRDVLAENGIGTFAGGIDPHRTHRLLTKVPRYVAMRKYFDRYGVAGARMMCTSAAIHVCVDAGADDEGRTRWDVAHRVGPVLVATFANSPVADGVPSGQKSSRWAAWRALDPTRTAPVGGDDPLEAWPSYALDAHVMFVRDGERCLPVDGTMTFGEWITDGHPLGHPDADDLAYHLTTLFPPVRAHGYLELRMIDMLPDPWWRAVVALVTALVCDPSAQAVARGLPLPSSQDWETAARCGLDDPGLRDAAIACMSAAVAALPRSDRDEATASIAREFVDRFTSNARSPADDVLETLRPSIAEAI